MSVDQREILDAVSDEWSTTREIAERAGRPIRYGSYTAVYHALQTAGRDGTIEQRIVKEDGQIRRAQWRRIA